MTDLQFPKRMASGKYVDLKNLKAEDIDLYDINVSLNTLRRFNGHYKDEMPLTIAQHTRLTMLLADIFYPKDDFVKFDCLLHDMPEAYYGDITTPLKHMFPQLYEYTHKVDKIVYDVLWPNTLRAYYQRTEEYQTIYEARKFCDSLSLDIERRCMWKSQIGKNHWPLEPENGLTLAEKRELFEQCQYEPVELDELYDELVRKL